MAIEENDRAFSLLKYEADKNYCREVVTIASGQNLKMGTIVGEKSADGTYKIVSIAADETDGSDTPIGVLMEDVDATSAAKEAIIVARDVIVAESALIYPTGATADQKKALKKALEGRGIVARAIA
ncbi:MAG: head decoration protein [Alphaproteobacteria bacterium]|nr:head decoration protein [Alphaproteobacteria bacterium]